MNVVVDGIIYELQSRGGVSRLFSEILPRMCQADESLNITLLVSGPSQQTLPQHPQIHIRSAPQIERFLQPRPVIRIKGIDALLWRVAVWHIAHRGGQLYSFFVKKGGK